MSTLTQGIDARGYLSGWLQGLASMYTVDIEAIPEDQWTKSFGGVTRNAGDLTADTVALMEWTTEAIKGNVLPMDEGFHKQYTEQCSTRAGATALLNQSVEKFQAALNSASDETLNSKIMAPWGMETPVFILANVAVSHVWYHDGQLNYIQCLLGDEKVHWMGN